MPVIISWMCGITSFSKSLFFFSVQKGVYTKHTIVGSHWIRRCSQALWPWFMCVYVQVTPNVAFSSSSFYITMWFAHLKWDSYSSFSILSFHPKWLRDCLLSHIVSNIFLFFCFVRIPLAYIFCIIRPHCRSFPKKCAFPHFLHLCICLSIPSSQTSSSSFYPLYLCLDNYAISVCRLELFQISPAPAIVNRDDGLCVSSVNEYEWRNNNILWWRSAHNVCAFVCIWVQSNGAALICASAL